MRALFALLPFGGRLRDQIPSSARGGLGARAHEGRTRLRTPQCTCRTACRRSQRLQTVAGGRSNSVPRRGPLFNDPAGPHASGRGTGTVPENACFFFTRGLRAEARLCPPEGHFTPRFRAWYGRGAERPWYGPSPGSVRRRAISPHASGRGTGAVPKNAAFSHPWCRPSSGSVRRRAISPHASTRGTGAVPKNAAFSHAWYGPGPFSLSISLGVVRPRLGFIKLKGKGAGRTTDSTR